MSILCSLWHSSQILLRQSPVSHFHSFRHDWILTKIVFHLRSQRQTIFVVSKSFELFTHSSLRWVKGYPCQQPALFWPTPFFFKLVALIFKWGDFIPSLDFWLFLKTSHSGNIVLTFLPEVCVCDCLPWKGPGLPGFAQLPCRPFHPYLMPARPLVQTSSW